MLLSNCNLFGGYGLSELLFDRQQILVHILCMDGFFHISWSQAHSSVLSFLFQILERVFVCFKNSCFFHFASSSSQAKSQEEEGF